MAKTILMRHVKRDIDCAGPKRTSAYRIWTWMQLSEQSRFRIPEWYPNIPINKSMGSRIPAWSHWITFGWRLWLPHAYILDVDGYRYNECCICFGVLPLGHRPHHVIFALSAQLERGMHFGSPHPAEVEFGEKFVECVPCAEMCVLANTGNEAIHKVIAIAREYQWLKSCQFSAQFLRTN